MDRQSHWDAIYSSRSIDAASWNQARPDVSLMLIQHAGLSTSSRIIDVGGGTSALTRNLLDLGFTDLSVLDISATAILAAQSRLGARSEAVSWHVADVTRFSPSEQWDLWHDRAVFHFLTEPHERRAYVSTLNRSLSATGQVVLATFSLNGPAQCSGLPVLRFDEASLQRELGADYILAETALESHVTPGGETQEFIYCRFVRGARVTDRQ